MPALVLDTSPLIALYLGESTAGWIAAQLTAADHLFMSTVNLTECLIILRQRRPDQSDALASRLISSSIEFVTPDADQAAIAADARFRYPLNLGDCFAYALAKTRNLPLLTLDQDFRSTDASLVLPGA
ncbi:MAG: type II toxin-antitoxin system VapC family toxin [Tepidisphaeraceae bacterium]